MPDAPRDAAQGASSGMFGLLAPKRDMARHRVQRQSRGQFRRTMVIVVAGSLFWIVALELASRLIRYFRGAEDIGSLLAGKLLAMILLAFASILLLSNVVSALSTFFLARDLDQIAAAPVRPWSLYGARLAETALHSSWMVALLLVPIIAAYGVAFEAGAAFVPFALVAFIPYLLIPAAGGAAITLLLVNVFPARRTRDLLSVVTALAVCALIVMLRAARPEKLARPEEVENFLQFIALLDAPSSPFLPSEWVSDAIMRHLEGESSWSPLLRLWGTAAGLVAVGGVLHRIGWARGFSQAQEGANRRSTPTGRRPLIDRLLGFLGATRRELVLKELRVFVRDSTQWSQLVMLGVLVVVYVSNVRYLPLSGAGITTLLRNVIPFLNLALAGFVLASVAARFVFPGVSLEGRVLWLLRSSPLAMRDLLWAKFWTGAVPLLVLALVLVGATNTMLGVRPFVQAVSLAAIAALVPPLVAMALSYGTFHPRFDTENAAQIPTSFGGLLFMMTAVALIAAVAWLTGRPAARFVVAEHFGRETEPLAMVLPFALALALCIGATVLPLAAARRQLERIDRA